MAVGGWVVEASGGEGVGYRIAPQFGLQIEEPGPGLVPFTRTAEMLKRWAKLAGVSVDALVGHDGQQFRENILITHRGLSGPGILQISSYWEPGASVSINLLPDEDMLEMLTRNKSSDTELVNLLSR